MAKELKKAQDNLILDLQHSNTPQECSPNQSASLVESSTQLFCFVCFWELQFLTQDTELQIRSSNPIESQGLIEETDLSQI